MCKADVRGNVKLNVVHVLPLTLSFFSKVPSYAIVWRSHAMDEGQEVATQAVERNDMQEIKCKSKVLPINVF